MNRQRLGVILLVISLVMVLGGAGVLVYVTRILHQTDTGPVAGITPTPTYQSGIGIVGNGCGVKKNSDGTYAFSWLHVSSDGKIVDEKNCVVHLLGFNMGPLFLGDAVGALSPQTIRWYKQNFPMNIVRINFNSTWWNTNVFVPKANMHFKAWLQQVVKWQEQAGNYVMLDNGPNYTTPPCGGTIAYCPPQSEGEKTYQANPHATTLLETQANINPGIQAWNELAKIYANDPAILYDAWNEPTVKDYPTFFQHMNLLINTIRTQNPRSLVVVYENGLKTILANQYPDYQQPNLVIDAHVYYRFKGTTPEGQTCNQVGKKDAVNTDLQNSIKDVQRRGHGFMIDEWGGCYITPENAAKIFAIAKDNSVSLLYFASGNVVTGLKSNTIHINSVGNLVLNGYKTLFHS